MLAATPRFSSSGRCGDAFGIVMVSGSLFLLWGHCMQYLDYMSIELYTINRTRSHPTALQKEQSRVGVGLPAMQTTRRIRFTAPMPAQASQFPHVGMHCQLKRFPAAND